MAAQALALLAALLVTACAQTLEREPQFDLVSFETQVDRDVPNDELAAVLAVELHGPDPAALAGTVNSRMTEALKLAASVPGARARSGNYQTFPRYDRNQRIESWQVSQELVLESRDFAAATALIGRLQDRLVVRSMVVRLSPEARRAAEETLIAEAVAAFHARAERVRAAMKAQGYRIRSLTIGTSSGAPPPRPFEARAAAQPVAVAPGESQVVVTASGSIQLR
jgi:predicted secreted protein